MAAEIKKSASGVYLLFVGEQVTEDDVEAAMQRYTADASASQMDTCIIVIEPIKLTNPLQAARFIAKYTAAPTNRYIVAGNGRDSMVIAERLRGKVSGTDIEMALHQEAAINRAKTILDVTDEPDFPTCNYL